MCELVKDGLIGGNKDGRLLYTFAGSDVPLETIERYVYPFCTGCVDFTKCNPKVTQDGIYTSLDLTEWKH